jgi:hypothetical protein
MRILYVADMRIREVLGLARRPGLLGVPGR